MKKRLIFLITILFLGFFTYSQTVNPTVVSSNGGYGQASQGSIAWTIGEPITETYTTSANIMTMGFQQPEELSVVTLIKEQGEDKTILVYPNPVQGDLNVNFGNIQNGIYQLELLDGLGKLVLKAETSVTEKSTLFVLSLNQLSNGNYYLKISKDAFIKTIKINKIK